MRCYNGCIPESDYEARYGYTQRQWEDLKAAHPHILITWFPQERRYSACVPTEGYRNLGDFQQDKMHCLQEAIKILENEPTQNTLRTTH